MLLLKHSDLKVFWYQITISVPEKAQMQHLVIFLKGLMMGAADLIPGVSGGTIALITGVYEKLLKSINSI